MLYVRYFCHGSQSENTETYAPWDCSTLRMSNNHRGVVIIYYYVFAFLGNGEFLMVLHIQPIDQRKDEKKGMLDT